MRKSFFQKALLLVILVVCLVGILAVTAFAEDTTTTEGTTATDLILETRYGTFTVPAASADKAWVAFNSDGTFIVGTDVFAADGESALRHSYHNQLGETHYVFLLRDHSNEGASTFHNACMLSSNVIIDLMGHTFTTSATGIDGAFRAQIKNNVTQQIPITFENGTILSDSALPFFYAYPGEGTPHFNLTFNSITFKTTGAASVWIASIGNGTGDPFTTTLNFNDCTFDLTNATESTRLFYVGNQNGLTTDIINIKGGTVIGNTADVLWYQNNHFLGASFNLLPDDNGEYLLNKRLTSDVSEPKPFLVGNSLMSHNTVKGTEGDYTIYSLAEDKSELGVKYADVDTYPFAVIDLKTNEVIALTPYLNGETEEHALYAVTSRCPSGSIGNFKILQRRDYTATDAVNTKVASVATVHLYYDLGGNTLTLGNTLYHAHASGPANITVDYITANGTIDVGANALVRLGDTWCRKTANFEFVDVDFMNIQDSLVKDDIYLSGTHELSAYIDFEDCTFAVAENNTSYLFALGYKSAVINVYLNILGGTFVFGGTSAKIYTTQNKADKYVTMCAGLDGTFPTVVLPLTDATSFDGVMSTPFGDVYYMKVSDGAETSTFELVQKTIYGNIPAQYLDANKYPFAIFNSKTNTFLTATPKLNGATSEYAFSYVTKGTAENNKTNYTILMRRDYATGAGYSDDLVAALNYATMTLDLNGYTLTLGDHLYFLYFTYQKTSNKPASVETKNGTINVGANYVLDVSAKYCHSMVFTATFTDVDFVNVNKSIVSDYAPNGQPYQPFTANISFTDCTFALVDSYSGDLFDLGNTTDHMTVNIHVYGSAFNLSTGAKLYIIRNNRTTRSVTFNANEQGSYPTIHVASTASIATTTYTTAEQAPLGLRNTAENTYVLTPFAITNAYLNITNDLNFVYRAFLPAGYTAPRATFTVDQHTIEVSEYTVVDGLYCFMLKNIGPHRMADTVTATVTATYNGAEETVTNNSLSVKSYADIVRVQNADNESLIALLDALLVYGANAQVYMGHNTGNLVAEIGELLAIENAGEIVKTGNVSAEYRIVGVGMRLGGAFDFGVQIKAADLTDLTLLITKNSVTTEVAITEDMKVGDYYVAYYNGLIASELDESVTFTLTKDGEQIGKSLALTANAYLAGLQASTNEKLANLVKALYAYGVAANTFAT